MKLEDVRNIAKTRGVHPGKHSKTELIKTLQAEEGNFDCFATAYNGECDQAGCLGVRTVLMRLRKESYHEPG